MSVNLIQLGSEKRFEELCQALLAEEFERFQPYSAPDVGMDGYDSDTQTIYQAYFPEKEPRREKIRDDLEKAKSHGDACKHWILLLPKNPTPGLLNWLKAEQQAACSFSIEVWGQTRISALLRKHKGVREQFYPTELQKVVRQIAKGKKPAEGDAGPGQEISPEQAGAIRRLIEKLAEEEAGRKKRKPRDMDYRREYGELNAHFKLSAYGRLPSSRFQEALTYLERKFHGRRGGDTLLLKRNRHIRTIHTIQKVFRIGEARYRQTLLELTGKTSTREMEVDELERVSEYFKRLQGLEDAR